MIGSNSVGSILHSGKLLSLIFQTLFLLNMYICFFRSTRITITQCLFHTLKFTTISFMISSKRYKVTTSVISKSLLLTGLFAVKLLSKFSNLTLILSLTPSPDFFCLELRKELENSVLTFYSGLFNIRYFQP